MVQNWIGSSNWSPIDAAFVPPDPERVPDLMADLVDYLNGAAHAPLIQAAVVHAQFETVLPVHRWQRPRRPCTHPHGARPAGADRTCCAADQPGARDVAGQVRRRADRVSSPHRPLVAPWRSAAVNAWLEIFIDAAAIAVEQSETLMNQIEELRADWTGRLLTTYRKSVGLRGTPRSGSAVARLLRQLPEAPVVTATTLAKILDISFPAASAALDEPRQAGHPVHQVHRTGRDAYVARDVLDLIHLVRVDAGEHAVRHSASLERSVPARPS